MGYSAEVPMEKYYRDGRISKIYEGTNEINRITLVKLFLKKNTDKFLMKTHPYYK